MIMALTCRTRTEYGVHKPMVRVISKIMAELAGCGPRFTNTESAEVQKDSLVITSPVSPGRGGSEAPMCFQNVYHWLHSSSISSL